jgi:hypothetical protein
LKLLIAADFIQRISFFALCVKTSHPCSSALSAAKLISLVRRGFSEGGYP